MSVAEYTIEIADCNSDGIRSVAARAGITHMRLVASGESQGGSRARLYELANGAMVLDANGEPVWREGVESADWEADLAYYGITEAVQS